MKAPAVQWYFGDWLRCAELRLCSVEARGLWIDMLALMHQATPYGHLIFNGQPMEAKKLGLLTGISKNSAKKLMDELKNNGVYSLTESGVIYCRRMVRDEAKRGAWAQEKASQRGKDRVPDNHTDRRQDKTTDKGQLSGPCPPDLQSSVLLKEASSQLEPLRGPPVDKSKAGSKSHTPKPPNSTSRKIPRSQASILAEGQRKGLSPHVGESMESYESRIRTTREKPTVAKFNDLPPREPGDDESELETTAGEPTPGQPHKPAPPAPKPANGKLPTDWAQTPDGIDHAGETLGMARDGFEDDSAYIHRINARIALG